MKAEIIPAILPKDFAEVEDKIGLVSDHVKTVQIDVCDGQFTSQPTWPYRKHDDSFERIVAEEQGLPAWEKLNFEIDLMANNPTDLVDQWVQAGASRIILHAAAKGGVAEAIEKLEGRVEAGVAFGMQDDAVSSLRQILEKSAVDCVQFMGIDQIGLQGQEFDSKVIEKVRQLRQAYPELPISVDGGVSLANAAQLIEAGATRLVVGSAIFNADNYLEALRQFKAIAAGA